MRTEDIIGYTWAVGTFLCWARAAYCLARSKGDAAFGWWFGGYGWPLVIAAGLLFGPFYLLGRRRNGETDPAETEGE